MKNMDAATRAKLDDKFKALVTQLEYSLRHNRNTAFMGRISDSSFVREDIRNLLKQAQAEGQGLRHSVRNSMKRSASSSKSCKKALPASMKIRGPWSSAT